MQAMIAETQMVLKYDPSRFEESFPELVNTLQVSLTHKPGTGNPVLDEDMTFASYKLHVINYLPRIKKVVLVGGEPALYEDLPRVIRFNNACGLKTTVYSYGKNMDLLEQMKSSELENTSIRIVVNGSDRKIDVVKRTNISVSFVYIIGDDDFSNLLYAAKAAERDFGCREFHISNAGAFLDANTSLPAYFGAVQKFLSEYSGRMDIHIARRGAIMTENEQSIEPNGTSFCRFGSVFPDNTKVVCPLDAPKQCYSNDLFYRKLCDKGKSCLLTKIVLRNLSFNK